MDIRNKLVVAGENDVWEGAMKQVRKIKRYKRPVTKLMSPRNEMHNMRNTLNNSVATLYDDRW